MSYTALPVSSSSFTACSAAAMALSRPLPDPEDRPERSARGGLSVVAVVLALLVSGGSVGRSVSEGLGALSAECRSKAQPAVTPQDTLY